MMARQHVRYQARGGWVAAAVAAANRHPAAVANNAGGSGFAVSDMQRLQRFLVLGCEGGSYYTGEATLALENATCLTALLAAGRGADAVRAIVDVSVSGRAAKQGPTLFALAVCARLGDVDTRRQVHDNLTRVCRIPTHLFQFIAMAMKVKGGGTAGAGAGAGAARTAGKSRGGGGSGWGRLQKKAVARFYNEKPASSLAYLVTKYKSREGFTHCDVLRLAHVKPASPATAAVLRYAAKGWEDGGAKVRELVPAGGGGEGSPDAAEAAKALHFLAGVEEAKGASEERLLELIAECKLAREHIPSGFLNSAAVWRQLLATGMPMTAMLRNLAKMTAIGVLAPLSEPAAAVCQQLADGEQLRKARVHPFSVLLAMKQYESGRGDRGSLEWDPSPQVVAALDGAFYKAFANVEPTGKRFLLGMDVSGSMSGGSVNGARCLTPRVAAAAMAMVTMRTEPACHAVAFTGRLVPLQIHKRMALGEVIDACSRLPFGATDCAQPMLYAMEHGLAVDVFMVYTDCETWAGDVTPAEALRQYRRASGIEAKLVVVAMTSSGFTLADPGDSGMLDVVGFDAAAPEVIRQFAAGTL